MTCVCCDVSGRRGLVIRMSRILFFNWICPMLVRMRTKMAIYQVVVISTLLYGAKARNATSQEEKHLAAFHTRCLRRILGVSWRDTSIASLKRRDFQKNWSGSLN